MSISRLQKQIIVGLVYIIIIGTVGFGVYDLATPDPTCRDGVQNQGEEGIDCGVVCGVLCRPAPVAPIVHGAQVLAVTEGDYDVVFEVTNPNAIYGSSRVGYVIGLKDSAGQELASVPGSFYLALAQTRYVVRSSIKAPAGVVAATLVVTDAEWQKIEPDGLKIDFPLRRESFTEPGLTGTAAQFEGVVFNDSDFDFNSVDVAVVLVQEDGQIIGVNKTELRTVLSRTERYFKVVWPTSLAGRPARAVVQATADAFSNDNFIRRYGTQEKFQEYYESR